MFFAVFLGFQMKRPKKKIRVCKPSLKLVNKTISDIPCNCCGSFLEEVVSNKGTFLGCPDDYCEYNRVNKSLKNIKSGV